MSGNIYILRDVHKLWQIPTELDYRHPGVTRDMHGPDNLDATSRGSMRPNSPSGIRHVIRRVGKVLLKEKAQFTTVMTDQDAHIEGLVNRNADAIHKPSKGNRI